MRFVNYTIELVHRIATGTLWKRRILALFVGSSFAVITYLFAALPLYLDEMLGNEPFITSPVNLIISVPLFYLGVLLMVWTSLIFFVSKGTPVPVDPPQKLITRGPYRYTRNPMHTGLFLVMIASGFYYGSLLSLFVFIPLYIALDTLMIRYIEEPGLVKRLGDEYINYRERTPMFFPWK